MEALINCRRNKSKILVITGSEKSGKDQIISAMQDLAKNKTIIIKKHTSRNAMLDDGEEMICANVIDFDKSTEEKIVYALCPKQKGWHRHRSQCGQICNGRHGREHRGDK